MFLFFWIFFTIESILFCPVLKIVTDPSHSIEEQEEASFAVMKRHRVKKLLSSFESGDDDCRREGELLISSLHFNFRHC